jgi:hypothetical protein
VRAYDTLLARSRVARDYCASLFLWNPRDAGSSSELPEDAILNARLEAAKGLADALTAGFGSGSSSGWTPFDDVIQKLAAVHSARLENQLYVSSRVDRAVSQFVHLLLAEVEAGIARAKRKGIGTDKAAERAAAERTLRAYEELRREVMESLRVEEILLG